MNILSTHMLILDGIFPVHLHGHIEFNSFRSTFKHVHCLYLSIYKIIFNSFSDFYFTHDAKYSSSNRKENVVDIKTSRRLTEYCNPPLHEVKGDEGNIIN